MSWLHSLDTSIFHFINGTLSNPVFDRVMPLASGNPFFVPVLAAIALALIWKGGTRGRIFLFLLLLVIALGDGWICNSIKKAVARPRPFHEFPEAHLLVGKGKAYSMPSSHAANWFAATMVTFIFYRRSWRFMLPLALLVSFSRVYNGAHYPTDILASAVLGSAYAVAFVWLADLVWKMIGRRWFPLWWEKVPSLINPDERITPANPANGASQHTHDSHFLRLGYIFIFALLA
ncbi:MAG: phosphatase PAP2 family protein, partial [Verrucomicrobiota bacterium]